MFCGWRLIESKPNLLKLGSGTLEIDAITGQCIFQGKATGQLTIAEEIRAWLQQDLATNKIPIAALTGAHLACSRAGVKGPARPEAAREGRRDRGRET